MGHRTKTLLTSHDRMQYQKLLIHLCIGLAAVVLGFLVNLFVAWKPWEPLEKIAR